MSKITLAALSAAGLLLSSAAFADDAKPVTPTPAAATADDNTVTCHAITHEGSVIHRSECHTQKEWDRIRFQNQQALRSYQLQSLYQSGH